jgi:protoheme ferro-lyase
MLTTVASTINPNQRFPSSTTKFSINKFPNIKPKQRACIYVNKITAMTSDEQLIQLLMHSILEYLTALAASILLKRYSVSFSTNSMRDTHFKQRNYKTF